MHQPQCALAGNLPMGQRTLRARMTRIRTMECRLGQNVSILCVSAWIWRASSRVGLSTSADTLPRGAGFASTCVGGGGAEQGEGPEGESDSQRVHEEETAGATLPVPYATEPTCMSTAAPMAREGDRWQRTFSMSGMVNASVLPVPVFALAITSSRPKHAGMAAACTSEHRSYFSTSARALRTHKPRKRRRPVKEGKAAAGRHHVRDS